MRVVRKTRRMEYCEIRPGCIAALPNDRDVTEHSFVISQAIEYRKLRGPRKTPVKRPSPRPKPKIADARGIREMTNARAKRATKIFPSIHLDVSTVPKPIKIRNNKQTSKPEIEPAYIWYICLIVCFFLFIFRRTIVSSWATIC